MESPLCRSITDLPERTQLIETFALGPDGVDRLDLHMSRMARSADALGFEFDEPKARVLVSGTDASEPLRARLTLSRDGMLDLSTAPMPAPATMWRFAIHDTRLSSHDLLLLHKTTQRELYNSARAALPSDIDEWVFLNERDEICEGTITNIAARIEGRWLTPPLASGCLPGTFRQHLLNLGEIEEAVLHPSDLHRAEEIHLMNALRERIPVQLVS
ncbi:aminotransferase class IV [Aliiroseovarius sp. KMU-50]|uniref:Probable branched-chain-amino-acid aminotransferase n=1 Tax=Aliiroseovarius salicola TaxID=3009082 RepID=A0ABT4VWA7_9RHOB|nr:aminotransferase class IV [Aliiroseovarius sp. KMU-50]MDA5092518.1 aminotransferase class IV [Aliiroseovarius sp. KMU-50]